MKATTTEEKNRVLAEFMGWRFEGHNSFSHPLEKFERHISEYSYHWNYHELMFVWFKFRDLYKPKENYSAYIITNTLAEWNNKCLILSHSILYLNVSETHKLIYEAVEWYNSINDKKE